MFFFSGSAWGSNLFELELEQLTKRLQKTEMQDTEWKYALRKAKYSCQQHRAKVTYKQRRMDTENVTQVLEAKILIC